MASDAVDAVVERGSGKATPFTMILCSVVIVVVVVSVNFIFLDADGVDIKRDAKGFAKGFAVVQSLCRFGSSSRRLREAT